MQENKSLVQEALIQMKNVEEAIAENAKGILASTMKEEINQLVKESLSEQDDEIDLDVDMDDDTENVDFDMDADNADEMGMDMDIDMDMDMDMDSDSPIDLTDASDEEILKVFKAMGEEDGIIVKKDGNEIHLEDDNNDVEYLVKLGESEEEDETMNEMDYNDDSDESVDDLIAQIFGEENMESSDFNYEMEEQEDDEEVVYEISLDEDEDEDDDMEDEDDEDMEGMYEEEDMDENDMYEEEDLDEDFTNESFMTKQPKGLGVGKGPKFSYDNKAKGGFNSDKKEGPKSVGTGKAKFEYKAGANMEGKPKMVKAETKEGKRVPMRKAHFTTDDAVKDKKGPGFSIDKDSEKLPRAKFAKADAREETKEGKHVSMRKAHFTTDDAVKDKKGPGFSIDKDSEKLPRAKFAKADAREETKEAARTYGNGSKSGRGLRKGITPNRNLTFESTNEEVVMLREKNEEYRKALNVFREKLTEVAIFNSNLAYATRLFTEHSTTKKEKINILRRFDDVDTLKESKGLYKSIKEELTKVDSKSINESVGQRINNTVSTGSSTTLIESKTYENPQFMRMKDLMSKLQ